ncbi:MAG: hypothetical protein Lokiarch_27070 [Candidatus Lokiarchaeum sp. GC14_75]|nr:MAG: hypothetical protein Lokiarch_27070 [Candidatus Lokiarchaeum sp. GC14_75]
MSYQTLTQNLFKGKILWSLKIFKTLRERKAPVSPSATEARKKYEGEGIIVQ